MAFLPHHCRQTGRQLLLIIVLDLLQNQPPRLAFETCAHQAAYPAMASLRPGMSAETRRILQPVHFRTAAMHRDQTGRLVFRHFILPVGIPDRVAHLRCKQRMTFIETPHVFAPQLTLAHSITADSDILRKNPDSPPMDNQSFNKTRMPNTIPQLSVVSE